MYITRKIDVFNDKNNFHVKNEELIIIIVRRWSGNDYMTLSCGDTRKKKKKKHEACVFNKRIKKNEACEKASEHLH